MRRTKIVATIGPASREKGVLDSLIQAGVNVVRLNFSHGEHHEHLAVLQSVRETSARLGRSVAVLQDLSGPKIRTGRVRDNLIQLEDGARVVISIDETIQGTPARISTTYDPLPKDVSKGDRILLDDGNLELRVEATATEEVTCTVIHGGPLKSNKGMNLPGVKLSTPALTENPGKNYFWGGTGTRAAAAAAAATATATATQGGLGGAAPFAAPPNR